MKSRAHKEKGPAAGGRSGPYCTHTKPLTSGVSVNETGALGNALKRAFVAAGKRSMLHRHYERMTLEGIINLATLRGIDVVRRADPGAEVVWYAKVGAGPAAKVGSTAALLAVLNPAVAGGPVAQRRVACEAVQALQFRALRPASTCCGHQVNGMRGAAATCREH